MSTKAVPTPPLLEKNNYERFAIVLRRIAWVWIVGAAIASALWLDLPSFLALELSSIVALEISSVVALELLAATAFIVGPGSMGLALSFLIERVSYLASDLNLF
jgi:hypothetical protein